MTDAQQIRAERKLNILVTALTAIGLVGGPAITFVTFKALTEQRMSQQDELNELQNERLKALEDERIENTRALTRIETKLTVVIETLARVKP